MTALVGALAAGILAGPVAALLTFFLVPLLGLAAIAFFERWRRVREDARVFLRATGNRKEVDRLARMRANLAAEFDRILVEAPEILGGPARTR
jgi:uncharacterized membrane protein